LLSFIDSYQKSWALRYIREAKAELTAAQNTPYMASSLILEGIRKAQAAVYFSLGDPVSAELIVHETLENKQVVDDPVLKFLVDMERTVQMVAMTTESERDKAMKEAVELVQIASEIVNLFTGEKTD
jgi:hypothetical protein